MRALRFIENKDWTITDTLTGLTWFKDVNSFPRGSWTEGVELCARLKSGDYGLTDGSKPGDWRMPLVGDILDLMDKTAIGPVTPLVAGAPFVFSGKYQIYRVWTATWSKMKNRNNTIEDYMGYVDLVKRDAFGEQPGNSHFVWPVKGIKQIQVQKGVNVFAQEEGVLNEKYYAR